MSAEAPAPRERPILMSGPMIRAILERRKTQTRRAVTRSNSVFDGWRWPTGVPQEAFAWDRAWVDQGPSPAGNPGPYLKLPWPREDETVHRIYPRLCPGTRLWVRESFMPAPMESVPDEPRPTQWNIAYAAGDQAEVTAPAGYNPTLYNYERWTPGMFMPRWASRITLEITDVRVERLQEISEADILAEGVTVNRVAEWCGVPWSSMPTLHHAWQVWWDHLNHARGLGWDTNPFCWALTFRRVEQPAWTEDGRAAA